VFVTIFVVFSLLLLLLLDHYILPFACGVILEIEVNFFQGAGRVKVDPEVLMVEDGLDRVVRGILDGVLAASGWLNEEGLLDFSVSLGK
jgi:hypothetical protein